MKITLLASFLVMAAYFLLLYAGVGLIQEKKFFSSAPREVLAAWDGVRNGFTFGAFFARYLVILYVMEAYDILFFDWVLLCHSNFFPRFYPEVKGIVGPHLFGYNKKAHLVHFLLYIPLSAALAWVCTLF